MSVHQDTDTEVVVYVRLLEEGTDVGPACPCDRFVRWNLPARSLETNSYNPNAEKWEFPPSTKVRCVTRKFTDGGECLVAVARAG
jgi:hypothetical protein